MFKSKIFKNAAEMESVIGDEDSPGFVVNEGESLVDTFNSGDESIMARLGGALKTDVNIDGKFAEAVFAREFILDVKTKAGTGIQELLVDKWSGNLYGLVVVNDVSELYAILDWRMVIETFETKNEAGEVVMTFNLPVYEELKDGKWLPDTDTSASVMEMGFMKYAKDNVNFKENFNE